VGSVERSIRRWLDELAETQGWVHHVADLDSGNVLTTPLTRPIAPLSRAERLSRLGHHFDTTVFDGPSYRLTPRSPFQAAPQATLDVLSGNYFTGPDHVSWLPPRDPPPGFNLGGMRADFSESPDRRSLLSIALQGQSWPGAMGHLSIRESLSGASIRIPVPESFASLTVDLTFIPRSGKLSHVIMDLEVGIQILIFHSIAFGALPPVVDPGS
jgi:hypothetical protein